MKIGKLILSGSIFGILATDPELGQQLDTNNSTLSTKEFTKNELNLFKAYCIVQAGKLILSASILRALATDPESGTTFHTNGNVSSAKEYTQNELNLFKVILYSTNYSLDYIGIIDLSDIFKDIYVWR